MPLAISVVIALRCYHTAVYRRQSSITLFIDRPPPLPALIAAAGDGLQILFVLLFFDFFFFFLLHHYRHHLWQPISTSITSVYPGEKQIQPEQRRVLLLSGASQ